MSLIHEQAQPYRNIRTDKEEYFNQFLQWTKTSQHNNSISDEYIIQLVSHPNFEPNNKEVRYFKKENNLFEETELTQEYKKANSFKNFKTNKGIGNPKGMFYELNLYSKKIQYSNHHTSTVNGLNFERDSSHDNEQVNTKGTHWKY